MYVIILTEARAEYDDISIKVPCFCYDPEGTGQYPVASTSKKYVKNVLKELRKSFPDSKYQMVKIKAKDLVK